MYIFFNKMINYINISNFLRMFMDGVAGWEEEGGNIILN